MNKLKRENKNAKGENSNVKIGFITSRSLYQSTE